MILIIDRKYEYWQTDEEDNEPNTHTAIFTDLLDFFFVPLIYGCGKLILAFKAKPNFI